MARRTYTDDEKAAGLAALVLHGGDVSKAARAAGVPPSTIRAWRDNSPATVRDIGDQKAADAAVMLERIVGRCAGLLMLALDEIENAVDAEGKPAAGAAALAHIAEINRVFGTAHDKVRNIRPIDPDDDGMGGILIHVYGRLA